MRRGILLIVASSLLAGGLGFVLGYLAHSPTGDRAVTRSPEEDSSLIPRSEVVSLELVPYPEGPPAPAFLRDRAPDDPLSLPLGLIADRMPDPLPLPVRQPAGCEGGGLMVIGLTYGRTVTYGPCLRPRAIDRLWNDAVAAIRGPVLALLRERVARPGT